MVQRQRNAPADNIVDSDYPLFAQKAMAGEAS
jgi:hypothetical protein